MEDNLDRIFDPQAVAVIGASKDPNKWGNLIAKSLISSNYKGKVYLINPSGDKVHNRRTYRSLLQIGNNIDLAIVSTPPSTVIDILLQCAEKQVKGVVIVTAHFGEYTKEGKEIESEIVRIARNHNMRIVGPNCMGLYNSLNGLNTTFISPNPGNLALLTQSGNFGVEINYKAGRRGLGFSKWVSFGNQADILLHEYINYVAQDRDTKVILLYIEGMKDGQQFLKVAKETIREKPIVCVKIGGSESGSQAAISHTGAIAGNDMICDAAFKQVGIIRANNIDQMLDIGEALLNAHCRGVIK